MCRGVYASNGRLTPTTIVVHFHYQVGMEPIHWAITEGHLPVLHFLVSKVHFFLE